MRKMLLLLVICGLFSATEAQMSKTETKQFLRMLQAAPTFVDVIDSLEIKDYHPDSAAIEVVRTALWLRMLEDQNRFPEGKSAFDEGKIVFGNERIGQFSLKVKGSQPAKGYPVYFAMHGGGGGPAEMNDEQWGQMQSYYFNSIDTGIYVAPRGPNNTWNLHFDSDAEVFYSQILAQLRLYAGADPNRIYLLGYSAGGDGVYQLAPRMASELAAASMSAGHHNGVGADNLQHVPMLLQVGELDDAYDRNKETVRYSKQLDSLGKRHSGEFRHQVYVHAGAEHSYVMDRRGPDFQAKVVADPIQWLENQAGAKTTTSITDAPTWLKKFRREPFPKHLLWDYYLCLEHNDDYFWVSNGAKLKMSGQAVFIEVQVFTAENRIEVQQWQEVLSLHLHEALVDPQRPLKVTVDHKDYVIQLRPSALEMAITMAKRTDPTYSFWQEVKVWKDAKGMIHVE